MRLAQFCKKQKMDKEQFHAYKEYLENTAEALYQTMLLTHSNGTGMYFDLSDYMDTDSQESLFIMQMLQEKGVEIFFETMEFRLV